MLESLAISLALTLALELGFALVWAWLLPDHSPSGGLLSKRGLAVIALMNCLTNPVVVLLHHTAVYAWGWPDIPVTAALELAAVLVEWQICRICLELKRPLLFATLINAFSFCMGCIINVLM